MAVKTTPLLGGPGDRPLSGWAALALPFAGLLCCFGDTLVSAQLGKYSLQYLVERESRPTGATRALTHKDIKSLPLGPDWSVLIQRRTPNLHCWIGPIGTVLTGENGVAVIGQ